MEDQRGQVYKPEKHLLRCFEIFKFTKISVVWLYLNKKVIFLTATMVYMGIDTRNNLAAMCLKGKLIPTPITSILG